ncbi:MAG: response regulator [Candidatus Latescibacteria bacterium]|nr:response regulator [Candidatus Latescibacterota bacterium]
MLSSSMILEKRQTLLKTEKIVVIEDETDILEVIAYNLKREGYDVVTSTSGEDGLEKIDKLKPNLVVLDLMLPEVDGIELCRKLKADPVTQSIPVIMVTAKGEESDVVLGLGVGADDYVTKPFSPRELTARVKAVLRRSKSKGETDRRERVTVEGVVIDPQRHEVKVDGEDVLLTATEFRLLHFLASHPGRVFTRDHLLTRVIGEDAIVIDRNIDVHVRAIRKKLGPRRELIETIRGVGYRFQDRD